MHGDARGESCAPNDGRSRVRFFAFWALNAAPDDDESRRQLADFARAGLDGVVVQPRRWPAQPPYLGDEYLARLSTVILRARDLGLRVWIYDENGWPSGTVGGAMRREHPEVSQRWAELVDHDPGDSLACFEVDGVRRWLVERVGPGVDYLRPDTARHFVRMTHQRYADGLHPEAFAHVEAFFDDEPEFGLGHAHAQLSSLGAIPWSEHLPAAWRDRHGSDLIDEVAEVFDETPRSALVRARFWQLVTDLLVSEFLEPVRRWCQSHGVLSTAHVKGEEHPLFQLPMVGSNHRLLCGVDLPGVDALGREPGNDFYPRQASSVSRQFGDGRVMAEAFGGAGWGAAPADLERHLDWLLGHGVTDVVLHQSAYRLDSEALADWPPSHPRHVGWSEVYPAVLDRLRRRHADGRAEADVLLVVPSRAVAERYRPVELLSTNVHDARTYPATRAAAVSDAFMSQVERLMAAGARWDVADEATIEQEARVGDDRIALGNARYRHVVLPNTVSLADDVARALEPFVVDVTMPGEIAAGGGDAETVGAAPAAGSVPSTATSPPPASSGALRWLLDLGRMNSQPVDVTPGADGSGVFHARIATTGLGPGLVGELVFADEVSSLLVDGVRTPVSSTVDGSRASVALPTDGVVELDFVVADTADVPRRLWVQGHVGVVSASAWDDGPTADVRRTEGPLLLTNPVEQGTGDLVDLGMAFAFGPVTATAVFELDEPAAGLELVGGWWDAIRVVVAGHDSGWLWGHDRRIDVGLAAGRHDVVATVVPSTFNHHGPHHHRGGDLHLVSPAQVAGARNFADPDDAPENTHVTAWHVRRAAFPEAIAAI